MIIEHISDREHASVYNNMITKREEEIADLQQKIEESKQFNEVSKRKRNEQKTTVDLLEKMMEEQHISDVNLRLLVQTVYVDQNVIFYIHNTNGSMYADSLIVHSPKLSEKGLSKNLSQFPISRGP